MRTTALAACGLWAAVAALAPTSAHATVQRTFVSQLGSDANPCTISLPCRGFTAALAQTNVGGEIIVLDSAGYGPVTITNSVSIIAPEGVYAGITVATGAGVTVGGSSLRVVLRGLTINGQGGNLGVAVFATNSEVHVERSVISGMTGVAISVNAAGTRVYVEDAQLRSNTLQGIAVTGGAKVYVDRARIEENANVGAFVSDSGELYVRDSIVHRNGTGISAVIFDPNTGTIRLVVERTLVSGSGFGGIQVQVQGPQTNRIDAVVADSTLVDNAGPGYNAINFQCFGSTSGALTLVDTTISHHLSGFANGLQVVGPGCLASVGRNTFTRNVTGMSGGASTLVSFGNNQLDQNGTDVFGAFTTKSTQ